MYSLAMVDMVWKGSLAAQEVATFPTCVYRTSGSMKQLRTVSKIQVSVFSLSLLPCASLFFNNIVLGLYVGLTFIILTLSKQRFLCFCLLLI